MRRAVAVALLAVAAVAGLTSCDYDEEQAAKFRNWQAECERQGGFITQTGMESNFWGSWDLYDCIKDQKIYYIPEQP